MSKQNFLANEGFPEECLQKLIHIQLPEVSEQ